jgi:hypothetical protein
MTHVDLSTVGFSEGAAHPLDSQMTAANAIQDCLRPLSIINPFSAVSHIIHDFWSFTI